MRIPIIAGNWKMHKTVAEALELVRELRRGLVE
ncbi:MAG: triose-phosphate isomerase, partial [Chloroflexota bacterium]